VGRCNRGSGAPDGAGNAHKGFNSRPRAGGEIRISGFHKNKQTNKTRNKDLKEEGEHDKCCAGLVCVRIIVI